MERRISKVTGTIFIKQGPLFILYSLLLFTFGCNSSNGQKKLSPKEFERRIKASSGNLIDVRTSEEYKDGHLIGALNVDFYDPKFKERIKELDRSKPTFVYCRSGKRSAKAIAMFKEEGFTQVYDLQGGILSWTEEQLLTSK
jgi:rhodanese-related sulfurtransferase